jgi:hypothetical protein
LYRVYFFMQMGTSSWERMPPDMAEEVMEHLKWDKGASAVFRKICKGWRDAHDQRITLLNVTGDSLRLSSLLGTRFPRVKEIGVRISRVSCDANSYYDHKWLRTLADLTALTSLDLSNCEEVSDAELDALAGLTALTSLNLTKCTQVSYDGFCALAGHTALTSLNLTRYAQFVDDGFCALAGLTALTSLNLEQCIKVSDNALHALRGLFALRALAGINCD